MMKSLVLTLLASAAIVSSHAQEPAKPAEPAAPAAPAAPAPAAPAAGDVVKLQLGVIPAVMQFDKKVLNVKPGQEVVLLFKNEKCPLQHNFILVNPGKMNEVGALADKMLADPKAIEKHYEPESPEILAHSNKLVGIGQFDLIKFKAPATPGDYPYLCTFPGHWRLMNGVLKVAP